VWGYQVGGGAELAVASGLGLGLEYLYSKYDDEDYFVAIGASNPQNAFRAGTNFRPSEQDFSFHTIRANLIYKF
jgi:outer membrane immunogenic protein